jgi:hypothetical protein
MNGSAVTGSSRRGISVTVIDCITAKDATGRAVFRPPRGFLPGKFATATGGHDRSWASA